LIKLKCPSKLGNRPPPNFGGGRKVRTPKKIAGNARRPWG